MPFKPEPNPGILHHYTSRLVAFEHTPQPQTGTSSVPSYNFLLWLGGLGDGLRSVKYPRTLSYSRLPPTWSVVEVLITAGYGGWASSSLAKDANDLAKAVSYFHDVASQRARDAGVSSKSKVVLMGHSTGANDIAEYLVGPRNAQEPAEETLSRPQVDGIILQAGISDREGLAEAMDKDAWDESVELARGLVDKGQGEDLLPVGTTKGVYGTGVEPNARRWLSLATKGGDDDYFSSDLPSEAEERIWGAKTGMAGRTGRIMVLMGGDDEHIPKSVDMPKLVKRWAELVKKSGGAWDEGSGIVEGASHNLNRSGDKAVADLCSRISKFLEKIEKGNSGEKL